MKPLDKFAVSNRRSASFSASVADVASLNIACVEKPQMISTVVLILYAKAGSVAKNKMGTHIQILDNLMLRIDLKGTSPQQTAERLRFVSKRLRLHNSVIHHIVEYVTHAMEESTGGSCHCLNWRIYIIFFNDMHSEN